ncbi:MAG: S1C family serine protease [Ilumatobacteraceae bacterium]
MSDSHWINTPPQIPTKRPLGTRIGAVVLILAIAFGGGLAGGILGAAVTDSVDEASNSPLVTAAPVKSGDIGDSNVAKAAEVIAPSVVTIDSVSSSGEAVGTGIIITSDGEILTNNHVVEGSKTARVRLYGQTNPITADVLATDPGNDMALIKLRNTTGLVAATFADSESIAVGDPVVAVGYALALDGGPSVTSGIISALNRTLQLDNETFLNALIQTDAAISSGNSGGPLINMNGQVVGINTAVANGGFNSAANNIGFAIGVKEVLRVNDILHDMAGGATRQQGFLGISLGNRTDGGAGAVIGEVTAGSPASKAGVRVNDIVLSINDQPIAGDEGLVAIIRDSAPNEKITLVVERDGKKVTLEATLIARPQD